MKKRINSCTKGKAGERELARYLTDMGFAARRTQQHCGDAGDSDVIIEGCDLFIECKREQANPGTKKFDDWFEVCREQCNGREWVLFHRNDRGKWGLYYIPPGRRLAHAVFGDHRIKEVLTHLVGREFD